MSMNALHICTSIPMNIHTNIFEIGEKRLSDSTRYFKLPGLQKDLQDLSEQL